MFSVASPADVTTPVPEHVLGNTQIILPRFNPEAIEAQKFRQRQRKQRYYLRNELRNFTNLERVSACGTPYGKVTLRCHDDGSAAGFGGIQTCGSVWACPVCAAKIARHRAEEVETVLSRCGEAGFHGALLTLTMRHSSLDALETLWSALSYAWGSVTSGRTWKADKTGFGIEGFIRATEVTVGQCGWHVHIHALIISENELPNDFAERCFTRWESALNRRGITALRDSGGLDFQRIPRKQLTRAGSYLVKSQKLPAQMNPRDVRAAAAETTLGGFKKAKRGNYTPFQLLESLTETGDLDYLDLWHEYEMVSKGKRALTWSRGFRSKWLDEPELTDEEIAEETEGAVERCVIDQESYVSIVMPIAADIINICETYGYETAIAFLEQLGCVVIPVVSEKSSG